jgi:EAL domain-containing protein (putative c-di-GMP-specific phosphodiesterase class I)
LRNSQIEVANSLKAVIEQSRPYEPVPVVQGDPTQAESPPPSWLHDNPVEPSIVQPTAPVAFEDNLTLALEPVVDLFTSKTAHYRLILGMIKAGGEDVPQELFLHHADHSGQRAALDCFVVAETIGILRKLRQRDPHLCIFMPIGATTLANREAMASLLQASANAADVANGLIFELHHSVLASLPEASLEGLATLARAGLTLSLSQASIAGIDLASLDRLNVRFVGLNAASIGIDNRISSGLNGFIQAARALRINIIITQVADPRHALSLQKTARYASGPAFAAPRRLRRNINSEAAYTVAA